MAEDIEGKSRRPGWIGGAILVFLGIVFLTQNLGLWGRDGNWWAVFIFIPAFILLWNAYNSYRAGESANGSVLIQGILGLFLAAMATVFLFDIDLNINWDYVWPVILILIGLSILLRRT